ncbi:putative sporulation protein YtxC [Aquibacillus koreensis]|uniref:Sporulation protein YtxC n=1 Tax=Aquibacillus koreensis TaxID=279446 RepID=A0A9X4AH14_9BACI|nr:sporulation protein YtxC [Aquibacillus koreensis]MCT2537199.1 putative sporulation protein YtxC [Aquibacillus koreensis]MDC3419229.1 putative sporulation protein YtxC [Aquibacillus koreensis]
MYFENKDEATYFCERLVQYDGNLKANWQAELELGNKIKIEAKYHNDMELECVASAMADVFISKRELNWITHIIKRKFYFTNKVEIQRIIDLSQSIISNEDEDLGHIMRSGKPRDMLVTLFETNMDQDHLHFDSIVQFRLHAYRQELINLVGLAIDEFKREEEYQSFIQSLREYIAKKEIKSEEIYVVQGDNFTFFYEDGRRIVEDDLKKMIRSEPLYIVGLDEHEMNLTPLIAMAPRKIKVYGDHPSEAKTMTIINIFQERVTFEAYQSFPFHDQKV